MPHQQHQTVIDASYGYLWCMRKGEERAYPAE
jgi:hypothetical protein